MRNDLTQVPKSIHCSHTRAVKLEHEVVNLALVGGVDASLNESRADDRVDVVHCVLHTLAVVDLLVLILPRNE